MLLNSLELNINSINLEYISVIAENIIKVRNEYMYKNKRRWNNKMSDESTNN